MTASEIKIRLMISPRTARRLEKKWREMICDDRGALMSRAVSSPPDSVRGALISLAASSAPDSVIGLSMTSIGLSMPRSFRENGQPLVHAFHRLDAPAVRRYRFSMMTGSTESAG